MVVFGGGFGTRGGFNHQSFEGEIKGESFGGQKATGLYLISLGWFYFSW